MLEALGCQNGPKSLVDPEELLQGQFGETAWILCWQSLDSSVASTQQQSLGMQLKSPLTNSHFTRFPNKRIGNPTESWTGHIWDGFEELSTCTATIQRSKNKVMLDAKHKLKWTELSRSVMEHVKLNLEPVLSDAAFRPFYSWYHEISSR